MLLDLIGSLNSYMAFNIPKIHQFEEIFKKKKL